ncbi:MAG: hypothetical protein AMJ60_00010 [Desulfobacterales bacterium SG8_35]|nr:MAG: hypothetical protein AMJ60_00010 [Desulfobacterales bacterium SG8_35]
MNYSGTKKLIIGITAAALLFAAGLPAAKAEEEAPSADASVGVYSMYVWRGFGLSDDSIVIQPSLTASYKGFSANLWANLDTSYSDEDAGFDSNLWNETDFTLSYDGAYEKLGYGVGWIYYSVVGSDTQEFYATLSYDVLLAPSFTIYYDTDGFAGAWYANLGIGHSFMIAEKYSLDLGLSFGYLDDNDGYAEFHNGLLSASMSFPIGEYISITPEIYWSFALSSEAEDYISSASVKNDDNFVYGGLSASFSF